MKRQKLVDVIAERDRLQRSESILSVALNCALSDDPDHVEILRQDGASYTFKLYGSARADGGIVIETFRCQGQRPYSAAYLLDDVRDHGRADGVERRIVFDRLTGIRNRIADEAA